MLSDLEKPSKKYFNIVSIRLFVFIDLRWFYKDEVDDYFNSSLTYSRDGTTATALTILSWILNKFLGILQQELTIGTLLITIF